MASQYYRDVVQKEIQLAGITSDDHILCIGGGVCPFSAILFHQITGAKVTVIDKNQNCIPKAKQIITRLGLSEKICVLCQDGASDHLSLSQYSVVHFALQVSPLDYVFSQVERQVRLGTKLLVRKPKKYLEKMYCRFTILPPNSYKQITHKKARNIGSTILYIKQGSVA